MSDSKLAQFAGQKYLNLESYRKNGQPVRTPLWFAEDDGTIYIYSLADAFKVKRIRNNGRVRIVPCDMRGKPGGEWVDALARIVEGEEERRGHALLDQKYGWMRKLGSLISKLRDRKRTVMSIRVD